MAKKYLKIIQRVNAYTKLLEKEIPISNVYIFGSHAKVMRHK